MPMTPFMGVRISWLIVARNSLLARAAARASSLARARSALAASTRSFSRRKSEVRSATAASSFARWRWWRRDCQRPAATNSPRASKAASA